MAGLAAAKAAAMSPAACWLVTALKELWSSLDVTGAVYWATNWAVVASCLL